jgi:hypothetical protein
MKNYSELVINEVDEILRNNSGSLALVKVKAKEGDETEYRVVNKLRHSYFLIDDGNVAELLIIKLLSQNVEVFDDFDHLQKKSPKNVPKPLFWPEDKPWPPEERKKD